MKIKKYIVESQIFTEDTLEEDKMVKFGGELSPRDGWVLIMVGGPASGKSMTKDNKTRFTAHNFDKDEFKTKAIKKIVGNKVVIGSKEFEIPDSIEKPYSTKNPEFVSWLHNTMNPIANKSREMMLKGEEGQTRLPNLSFDITGSEMKDFERLIPPLKEKGYKICVVWCFQKVDLAVEFNQKRARTVPNEIVLNKHYNVFKTINELFGRTDLTSMIDDFWISFPVQYEWRTPEHNDWEYTRVPNIEKVDLSKPIEQQVFDLIDEQIKILKNKYNIGESINEKLYAIKIVNESSNFYVLSMNKKYLMEKKNAIYEEIDNGNVESLYSMLKENYLVLDDGKLLEEYNNKICYRLNEDTSIKHLPLIVVATKVIK